MRHGSIILDPDGVWIVCPHAAFIWHERDAQGNLIAANEEFEVGMGTLATYVGVLPDASQPGGVRPAWGTAELLALSAQAKAQIDGQWADPGPSGSRITQTGDDDTPADGQTARRHASAL